LIFLAVRTYVRASSAGSRLPCVPCSYQDSKHPRVRAFPQILTKKNWKTSFPPILAQNEVGRGRELRGQLCLHSASPPRGHGSARVAHDCCSAKVRFAVTRVAPGAARHAACGTKTPLRHTWRQRGVRERHVPLCTRSGRSWISGRSKHAVLYWRQALNMHSCIGPVAIVSSCRCSRRSNLTKSRLERGRGAKLRFCSFCRFHPTLFR